MLNHSHIRHFSSVFVSLRDFQLITQNSSENIESRQSRCKFVVNFIGLLQPVNMQVLTNFSISLSCNKFVKIRLVATCHLQTCHNLLKQLAASLWITSFDNQLATSLLTTCNRLVVNKLSQSTHHVTSLLQDVC